MMKDLLIDRTVLMHQGRTVRLLGAFDAKIESGFACLFNKLVDKVKDLRMLAETAIVVGYVVGR